MVVQKFRFRVIFLSFNRSVLFLSPFEGLSTAMNLLSYEGKYPLEPKAEVDCYVPVNRLKAILMKLLSNKTNNASLINKYEEYLMYDDVLLFTWKILPYLTAKSNPNDVYIMNYLLLLEKLHLEQNKETQLLCFLEGMYKNLLFVLTFFLKRSSKNIKWLVRCLMI